MLGGIEAGGTKFVCVVGTSPERIVREARFPTREPAATIADAIAFFRDAAAGGHHIDALGVASFGPVELRRDHPRYGFITTTPKPGWSGTDLVGPLRGHALVRAHQGEAERLAEGELLEDEDRLVARHHPV